MGPITNLLGAKVTCIGLGNAYTRPLGYIVIWVQVYGVQGHHEDQIALVILDLSNFAATVPIILGTPTISCIVNVMTEKEIDALVMPWANARVAHLLSVCRMTAVKVGDGTAEESDSDDYDQVMFTQKVETIEAFSSCIVLVKAEKAYTGGHINSMALALWTRGGSLPQGLTIQNMYTELRQGSKKAVMVVRNSTAYPQILWKKTPVARAVVATPLPGPPVEAQLQEGWNWAPGSLCPKIDCQVMAWKTIWWIGFEWVRFLAPEMADAAHQLLGKYHDVFSLDPTELGCTHSTEHTIKVTDDSPFKEWFSWIPPPLVEEAWNHLQEMLESGAIWPSQSAWCNALVLVRKKDGGLQFCIDFHHLNTCTKKDSYPLPRIHEALESLVGAGHFSCWDLGSGFW